VQAVANCGGLYYNKCRWFREHKGPLEHPSEWGFALTFPGEYGRYGSIGISLVLTTAVYIYLGYRVGTWLDDRWQSAPVGMVSGIVLGMVLSVLSLVKEVMVLQRSQEASARPGKGQARARDREKENFPEGEDSLERDGSPTGKDGR